MQAGSRNIHALNGLQRGLPASGALTDQRFMFDFAIHS